MTRDKNNLLLRPSEGSSSQDKRSKLIARPYKVTLIQNSFSMGNYRKVSRKVFIKNSTINDHDSTYADGK